MIPLLAAATAYGLEIALFFISSTASCSIYRRFLSTLSQLDTEDLGTRRDVKINIVHTGDGTNT